MFEKINWRSRKRKDEGKIVVWGKKIERQATRGMNRNILCIVLMVCGLGCTVHTFV